MTGMRDAIEAGVGEVRVCRSASVTRVRDDGTVDVQPLVAEPVWVRGALRWELPPEIPSRPVQWLRAGAASVAGRLSVGQEVTCIVRDLDHADADAGVSGDAPTSGRRFDWSDAIVLGGFTPPGGWPANSLPTGAADIVAYMDSGGVWHFGTSAAALLLARADLVLTELQAIQTAFNGHVHGIPPLSAGPYTVAVAPLGPPFTNVLGPRDASTSVTRSYTAPPAASDIASDRVKVDS